ncbi:MAG: AMP-binding protein [Spirochaeta sp.]|jgi:long-chain acyl-CoA synthetase|nr:AMP-binding protein [Spirochaeta sp.]
MGDERTFRLIFNPEGDATDVVAYGAAVAEGRIAGKYQLSTTSVPDTLIVQKSTRKGIIAGADVKIDRDAATAEGIQLAKAARQGRNGARAVGTIQLSDVMNKGSRAFESHEVAADDPAVILYTSGTTGNPKGVTLTHRNFWSQRSTVVASIITFTPEDRVVGVLPLYHVYGLANGLVPTIANGASFVMVAQYSPQTLLKTIADASATIMPAIPSMYQHLLAIARARKTNMPKSLRSCVSGGAPLPLNVLQDFKEVFETQIVEGYGLTETTSSVCANGRTGTLKEGSIGPVAVGVEMAIFDDNDNPLPDGEAGEIVIRGEIVTPGYWNNPDATAEAINADGWFHTGDLGYRDEDGFYFITDRKKDLIIRGGFNISPREVEEVIMMHPKIADAAVVAAPDRHDQEMVKAYIVLHEGETLTEREVMDHCVETMAPYKRPKAVVFVDSLPKSATGKVLRTELRGETEDRRLVMRDE